MQALFAEVERFARIDILILIWGRVGNRQGAGREGDSGG